MQKQHYSIEQLRFLGVLNTCKVLKMGLPSRVGYEHVGEPLRASLPPALQAQFVRYGKMIMESECRVVAAQ